MNVGVYFTSTKYHQITEQTFKLRNRTFTLVNRNYVKNKKKRDLAGELL